MIISAVQHNIMYTVHSEGEVLIRQFTRFDSNELEDQIIWYENSGDGSMLPIDKGELFDELEEEFKNLLE